MEDADFERDSLDVILCHNGMFYFQDQYKVVQKVYEWLRKPGGRFAYNVQQVPFDTLYAFPKCLCGHSMHNPLPHLPPR